MDKSKKNKGVTMKKKPSIIKAAIIESRDIM